MIKAMGEGLKPGDECYVYLRVDNREITGFLEGRIIDMQGGYRNGPKFKIAEETLKTADKKLLEYFSQDPSPNFVILPKNQETLFMLKEIMAVMGEVEYLRLKIKGDNARLAAFEMSRIKARVDKQNQKRHNCV